MKKGQNSILFQGYNLFLNLETSLFSVLNRASGNKDIEFLLLFKNNKVTKLKLKFPNQYLV